MSTKTLTTTEATARLQQVFREEMEPLIDAVYNFAYSLVRDEHRAGDLTQEAYAKAWKYIKNYHPGTNAKAWLFRITQNEFINFYRKQKRAPQSVELQDFVAYHGEDGDTRGGSSAYVDLSVELFQEIMGDEITEAMNGLDQKFRTVVLLCDIEDFTYEEVAAIVNVPIGTVRSRLHRGRNLLKSQLKGYAEQFGYEDKRK